MSTLEERLLAAHATGDKPSLVELYREAAGTASDENAKAFFLTQAYVFALDCGDPAAPLLKAELRALGREQ